METVRGGLFRGERKDRVRERGARRSDAAHSARPIVRLFTGTLLFLRGRVRSGVGDPLTQRRTPRRGGTPVWIIYSGCIPGNFREAVLR